MNLKTQLTEDMKTAMRSKDTERLATIRLALAALKQKEIDERLELSDAQVIAILDKLIKQRRDSIVAFQNANRQDLADKEAAELVILQSYLPVRLDQEAIETAVQTLIQKLDAKGPTDMGRVMAAAKAQLAGQADMALVSKAVKQLLG